MAITYISVPADWSPSDNPLSYVFSSNQAAQANFSFIVETYFNNVIISTDRLFPRALGRAQFDVSPFIMNRLNGATLTSDLIKNSGTSGRIRIRVQESYGTPATLQASLFSAETNTFKCSLPQKEWENLDIVNDYIYKKWLTNEPNLELNILTTQDVPLSIIAIGVVPVASIIIFFDINGNLLEEVLDYFNFTGINIAQFNLSRANMATIYSGNYDNVYSFSIQVEASQEYRFNYIKEPCYQPVVMYWLNEFGVFDSFMITHNEIKKHSISAFEYKKQYGQWLGNQFVYDSEMSGNSVYSKTIQAKGTLTTGYMTELIQAWFVTSYHSPRVLLGGLVVGDFRAITITNTTNEEGQQRFEELIKEEVAYEDNNSFKSIKV